MKKIPLIKQLRNNQVIGDWATKTKDLDARERKAIRAHHKRLDEMDAMHGGKRKGAGRKPSGRRPFLVRMKPETYVVLQSKAKGRPVGEYLDARYAPEQYIRRNAGT